MSPQSINLRKQADKCRQHANALSDNYAQVQLLKLADEYIARAIEIESKEKNNGRLQKGRLGAGQRS